jgi:hypothetical protein
MKGSRMLLVGAVTLALAAAGTGSTNWASAHGGDANLIHACLNPGNGTIYAVAPGQACGANQTALDWNIQGVAGPAGPAGAAGATGPAGPAGADGEDGAVGPAGPTGATGPAGPEGPAGPQGPHGEMGPAGADGADGVDGAPGAQGPQGETGPMGPPGPAGPTGVTGAQGPQGEMGPAGADGQNGAVGPQGPMGPQGPAGPTNLTTVGGPVVVLPPSVGGRGISVVTCPAGKLATGGGYAFAPSTLANVFINVNAPAGPNAWRVEVVNNSTAVGIQFQAVAQCTAP